MVCRSVRDLFERCHLSLEVRGALELLVDRGKTKVGDLVDEPKLLEHYLPDLLGGDFAPRRLRKTLGPGDDAADRIARDRSISQCRLDPATDLATIERLYEPGPLADEERWDRTFIGREPKPADLASAPSTNRRIGVGGTRVDDPRIVRVALGALHDPRSVPEGDLRAPRSAASVDLCLKTEGSGYARVDITLVGQPASWTGTVTI